MTGCQRTWHRGVHTCFLPPVVLLPWICSVSSGGVHSVCYPMASMGWDIYFSAKCTWSCRHPLPLHITRSLHPSAVDALVDIHGRSHSFMLIHPREVFLAWCWVISRPLSSRGIVLLSFSGSKLNWGVSDVMRRSQLWCRMCDCLHSSITSYEGMSVMIWCTTSWGLSSHLCLIFFFPWKASTFTNARLPGFKFTVPIFQSWYHFCHWASAVDWAWAFWRAGLSQSWTVTTYSSTCLVEAPLLGTCAPKVEEVKVNWEPWPASKL